MSKIFRVKTMRTVPVELDSKIVSSFYQADDIEQVLKALMPDRTDEATEILEISQVIDSVKNVSDFLT